MKLQLGKDSLKMDKKDQTALLHVAIAIAVAVFCLVSAKMLVSRALYQHHLISAKNQTANQLTADKTAADSLTTQYQVFATANPNVLGGSTTGSGSRDGFNPDLVFDALPTTYDFPGLTSSIEKILKDRGINGSITGTDNSLSNQTTTSANPQPVVMTITVNATTSYANLQNLISDLMRSIRPFNVNSLQISGNQNAMQLNATIDSYYQPAKILTVQKKAL